MGTAALYLKKNRTTIPVRADDSLFGHERDQQA
jgi:hypothetical protein